MACTFYPVDPYRNEEADYGAGYYDENGDPCTPTPTATGSKLPSLTYSKAEWTAFINQNKPLLILAGVGVLAILLTRK